MASRVPWPTSDPEAWQVLFLGGAIFPGLATVKVSGGQKVDTKDAPGADGESTTLQGEKAKSGKILLRMWEATQWDVFDDVFALVEPPIGKRTPLDIACGATAFRNVHAIIIEQIDGPDWDADHQWMDVSFTWKEHKPPPPKNATTKLHESAYAALARTDRFNVTDGQLNRSEHILVEYPSDEDLSKAARESSQLGFHRSAGGARAR